MKMDLEGEYQFQCQWGIGVFNFRTIGVVGDSLNEMFRGKFEEIMYNNFINMETMIATLLNKISVIFCKESIATT